MERHIIEDIDCSYSGIVNVIDGDKKAGEKLIRMCVKDIDKLTKQLQDAKHEVVRFEGLLTSCWFAIEAVKKHLDLEFPIVLNGKFEMTVIEPSLIQTLPLTFHTKPNS